MICILEILSPVRLPVSPPGLAVQLNISHQFDPETQPNPLRDRHFRSLAGQGHQNGVVCARLQPLRRAVDKLNAYRKLLK